MWPFAAIAQQKIGKRPKDERQNRNWNPYSPLLGFPFLIKWPNEPIKVDGDPKEFRRNVMREVLRDLKYTWEIDDSCLEMWCPK